MEFQNDKTLSAEVKEQIRQVKDIWLNCMGKTVTGIYIHGSIVLNCFVEGVSDIDLLILCDRHISREERLRIARDIIEADNRPASLEMSAIWTKDLKPWKHPTSCQFHYSNAWTGHYQELLSGKIKESFLVDEDFCDGDIACHVHLTNQSGICIYGKPVKEAFPVVPEEDFWRSISNDIDEYDFRAYDPKYFSSNILILGRILSYKKEKRILSKYDGGIWARDYAPESFRYVIDHAIREWYCGEKGLEYKEEDLNGLRQWLINEIKN
ncbi:streptomycin 3'-adenylyltransferase [Anaerotaenia torta]|uniref:aminoglycoside adenylyltransferase domain-containing protein n=1 Tax=Anaerotaenia torta TaxID=433293 RepID=UPI003D22FCD5